MVTLKIANTCSRANKWSCWSIPQCDAPAELVQPFACSDASSLNRLTVYAVGQPGQRTATLAHHTAD